MKKVKTLFFIIIIVANSQSLMALYTFRERSIQFLGENKRMKDNTRLNE